MYSKKDPHSHASTDRRSLRKKRGDVPDRAQSSARGRRGIPGQTRQEREASEKNGLVTRLFLNVPYVDSHEDLILAYLASSVFYSLTPIILTEQPTSLIRLDRLRDLISGCDFSIHDLSYVKLDHAAAWRLPRFNMPLELGMALALKPTDRIWVFEKVPHRLWAAASDLGGIDPKIHGGEAEGIFRGFREIFAPQEVTLEMFRTQMELLRAHCRKLKREGHKIWDGYAFPRLVAGIVANLEGLINAN